MTAGPGILWVDSDTQHAAVARVADRLHAILPRVDERCRRSCISLHEPRGKVFRLRDLDDRFRTSGRRHAAELLDRRAQPREVGVLAGDDVLVRVVEIQVADVVRDGHVAQPERGSLGVEVPQECQQLGWLHDCCFSLQVMHTRVQGIALSRAGAIGSPQSRQVP